MTEFLARISSRRPWVTVGVWGVLVALAIGLTGALLGSATTTDFRLAGRYESERAATLLEDRLRGPKPLAELVIVQSPSLTVDDDAFRAKVDDVHAAIVEIGPETIAGGIGGQPIYHYYQALPLQAAIPAEQREQLFSLLVSPDKRTVLMHYTLAGDSQQATENIEEVIHVVRGFDGTDDFRVLIGGDASVAFENNELSTEDLEKGERFGIPIALIILLVLFGAVAATLLPLGMAIIAIVLALAAVSVIGQYFELLFFVQMMVTMIGLAVGIDYSLLIVSRYREEMGRGLDRREAVVKAGATAGRTVLFSGSTVVVALLGMLIVPVSFFQSLGLGAILVVLAALAATLTLLPALLALLGRRVDFLSIPFLSKYSLRSSEAEAHGFWVTVTHTVTRFPVISILIIAVPMVVLSFFYFGIKTGLNDVNTFPDKSETKAAFIVFEEEFSMGAVSPAGILSPAEIVVDGDVSNPQVQEGIARLVQSLLDDPTFPVAPQVEANDAGDLTLLTLPFPGKPNSRAATDTLTTLREVHVAAAFKGVPAEVYVGGVTAEATDFFGIVDVYTPIVFAFVLGTSFIILMLVFRSIVIPIKAIIMNLLSVGATYGLLVLVFQKGVGTDLLGFQHAEVIDAWIPLFLFSILFGLSMDYHVFLLSRIRERYDETGDNTKAVAYGLQSTGGMITGAALIMVAVFGAFAAGETIVNQQVGFGLAIAVFLDAALVRSILVPASMEVLGKGNWYLPPWLHWLPNLRVESEEA
ncbi:MAG: MMPL family transporter [Chloroflexi bacterium]|nr:MMPL family transporter [Chloroflexota bacterium]